MDKRKINTFKEVEIKRYQITISDTYQLSLGRLVDNLIVDETGDIEEIGTKNLGEIFERNGYTYFLINGQSFDETKHTKLFEILGTNIIPNGVGRYLKATNNNSLEFKNQRFPKHKHIINHTHNIPKHSHNISGSTIDNWRGYLQYSLNGGTSDANIVPDVFKNENFTISSVFTGNSSGFETSNANLVKSNKIFSKGSKSLYYVKSKGA